MKMAIALVLLALLAGLVLPSATLKTSSNHREGSNDIKAHDNDNGPETNEEDHEVEFEAEVRLSGSQQVPSVTTLAFGEGELELVDNGTALKFEVQVCDIANVTAAHIHVGASGTNGPVVLFLFGPNAPLFSAKEGCEDLSSGTLTPLDLIARPALGINTWNDFVMALLAGNTYINVHTTANPGGEIRGQLTAQSED